MDSRYFGFQYKVLRTLGMGMFHDPVEDNFNNYPTLGYLLYSIACMAIYTFGYWLSEAVYAYNAVEGNLNVSMQSYSLVFTGVQLFGLFKIIELIRNRRGIQEVVKVLEIDCKEFRADATIEKESLYKSKVLSWSLLSIGNVTIICICIYAAIVDYRKTTSHEGVGRVTPFLIYVPWDTSSNLGYAAAFFYSGFGMLWFGNITMVGDTLVASILIHLSGQFKMIQRRIENVGDEALLNLKRRLPPSRSDDMAIESTSMDEFLRKKKMLMRFYNEDQFNEEVLDCLKTCIKYHQLIINTTRVLQQAYSQTFFIQVLSSFYVIGLALFQNAQDATNEIGFRVITNLGILFSAFWQLFMQTYGSNELTLEGMKISESAYSCCWYAVKGDKGRVKSLLIVLMIRAQSPIYLTAGKFGKMSNEMFVSIVRSSYQIFTLVNTVLKDKK